MLRLLLGACVVLLACETRSLAEGPWVTVRLFERTRQLSAGDAPNPIPIRSKGFPGGVPPGATVQANLSVAAEVGKPFATRTLVGREVFELSGKLTGAGHGKYRLEFRVEAVRYDPDAGRLVEATQTTLEVGRDEWLSCGGHSESRTGEGGGPTTYVERGLAVAVTPEPPDVESFLHQRPNAALVNCFLGLVPIP